MVHARRSVDHDPLPLEVNPVAAGGQTLHLIKVGFIAGIAMKFMPGINQCQRIAIHHRGAGEAAVFILGAFRGQRHRQMFPVHQIFTARVTPVHRPPFGGVRMVLVKRVVPAVKPDQAIGIVDPARTGGQVIARIPAQVQLFMFSLQFLLSPGN